MMIVSGTHDDIDVNSDTPAVTIFWTVTAAVTASSNCMLESEFGDSESDQLQLEVWT
jgi:hypothetical protein